MLQPPTGNVSPPRSGLPIQLLRVDNRIRYRLLSTTADLVRGTDGPDSYRSFENASQDLIQLSVNQAGAKPEIALRFADWDAPRPLIPAGTFPAPSTGAPDEFAGLYRSPVYGVVYEVRTRNANQLEVRIGAGARFADRLLLTRVAGDIFESTQERTGYYLPISPVVRFRRDNSRVAGMVVTGNGVRGLELRRLSTRQ